MRITFLCRVLWPLAFAAANLYAAEEQDLIATLQSAASTPQQWAACQRLRIIGTAKAVPALAALLTDERASQAARHALEGLPYPEAGVALRDALAKTSGLTKAGVIDSLGWRAESASVPVLTPLLSDSDTTIAAAAAAALGRIGGQDAIVALSAACGQAPVAVQPAVQESLLKCAERLAVDGDRPGAAAVYRGLLDGKCLPQIRPGAWRGLALADSQHQADVVMKALTGADRPIQIAALKLLREVNDRPVIQACLNQWTSLPIDAQLAVLDSQAKLGAEARPTARLAAQSPNALLRTAAWEPLGALNDSDSIPALAKAAAHAEPAESQAAREALARMDGPGVKDALLSQITASAPPEKAELLRALGERGDRSVTDVLLQNANSDVQPVRLAALESLTKLAPPEAVSHLLDIAAESKSDDDRDPVLKALYAVYEASPNKAEAARGIIDAMGRFPAAQRRQILPLLAEIAGADALSAAQTASRDPDAALAKEAVRVLAQWPDPAPAAHLLELARASSDPTLQVLALRGAINVAAQEPDSAKRLALLQQSLAASKRLDEKKQVLGQIGQIPTPNALNLALKCLPEAGLADEAGLAAVTIAEKLASSDAKLADEAAARILAQIKEGELAGRAWALRVKPTINVPFIRDWQVSGPYRQAGAVGAVAIFNIPFAPENPGQNAEWNTMPPSDQPNLAALFPGQENCAAYLRTRLVVPEDCHAALLTGSDDGLKAWLNGQVVQSKNVDRGEVVDQDAALIHLKRGTNELLLKISQGGGGWGACARIVGIDFKPVPGLQVDCPPSTSPTPAPR